MSIRFRRIIGKPIPGGFHYPIPGGPVVKSEKDISSEAIQELIDKVAEYRVNNGLPEGNPEIEITAYYAIHYPFAVENGDREEHKRTNELLYDVYTWVNSLWRNPPKALAEPDEVEKRQKACILCPWRVDLPEGDTQHASEAQRRAYLLSRGGLGPDGLGYCQWHRHDNRLACMLTDADLPIKNTPACCWLNKKS